MRSWSGSAVAIMNDRNTSGKKWMKHVMTCAREERTRMWVITVVFVVLSKGRHCLRMVDPVIKPIVAHRIARVLMA